MRTSNRATPSSTLNHPLTLITRTYPQIVTHTGVELKAAKLLHWIQDGLNSVSVSDQDSSELSLVLIPLHEESRNRKRG